MKLLIFCVIIGSLWNCGVWGAPGPPGAMAGFKNVGVDEFDKLRADRGNVVLDVRTPAEFKSGHLPGALHIDWNGPDFEKNITALDKEKGYLVHCATGRRSAKAASKMIQLGFKKVYNLEGGIKAWQNAGKPIEK